MIHWEWAERWEAGNEVESCRGSLQAERKGQHTLLGPHLDRASGVMEGNSYRAFRGSQEHLRTRLHIAGEY